MAETAWSFALRPENTEVVVDVASRRRDRRLPTSVRSPVSFSSVESVVSIAVAARIGVSIALRTTWNWHVCAGALSGAIDTRTGTIAAVPPRGPGCRSNDPGRSTPAPLQPTRGQTSGTSTGARRSPRRSAMAHLDRTHREERGARDQRRCRRPPGDGPVAAMVMSRRSEIVATDEPSWRGVTGAGSPPDRDRSPTAAVSCRQMLRRTRRSERRRIRPAKTRPRRRNRRRQTATATAGREAREPPAPAATPETPARPGPGIGNELPVPESGHQTRSLGAGSRRSGSADRDGGGRRHVPDIEHRRDRGDPAIASSEKRPAVGDRPDELLVDVKPGSRSSRRSRRSFSKVVARQPREDQVLLGGVFAHHAEDLDAESLDSRAVAEVTEAVTLLAEVDARDLEDGRGGRTRGRRRSPTPGCKGQDDFRISRPPTTGPTPCFIPCSGNRPNGSNSLT